MTAGCQPGPSSTAANAPGAAHGGGDDHGHHHGHDHSAMGPHDGHIVEIGDEQLHAEWTHNDDTGEVVVYLLDSAAEADTAISAETILIKTKIGPNEKSYELAALSQDGGKASKFTLTDPALVEALKAVSPGIEATIVVQYDGEELVGKFEAESHAGHQH